MQENSEREAGQNANGLAFALGALRTGGVLGAFLAFGLGYALLLAPAPAHSGAARPPYSPAVPGAAPSTPGLLWLIDGYNVVCASLLAGRDRAGWWRSEYRVELLERLGHFEDPTAELWVVFDGGSPEATPAEVAPSRVRTMYAPSADAWLIDQVKAHVATRPVTVVTGDRQVADRARHRGADVIGPRALLGRCTG
jgi:predicted RNA-binding protein with PIN domain